MAINDDHVDNAKMSGEVLRRVNFDLAYSSEKLLNLDLLLMYVASRASEYEALVIENEDVSSKTAEKALELDALSGFVDSEVNELGNFMVSLQKEILDVREKLSVCEHFEEASMDMEKKLHDCEDYLKQSQCQISEMQMQAAKVHNVVLSGASDDLNGFATNFPEDRQCSFMESKMKMSVSEQQRHVLRMLEKSLAKELDLEKKLVESKYNQEELKLKMYDANQELFYVEKMSDLILERFFGAENIAEVLMGISKELLGKLQIAQFNLNGSVQREADLSSKLQQQLLDEQSSLLKLNIQCSELDNLKTHLKEAEYKYDLANSEAVALREKVKSLQSQLRESESQLHHANTSIEVSQELEGTLSPELKDLKNAMEELKSKFSNADNRAKSPESKCEFLADTNSKLNKELDLLRSTNTIEEVNSLEKQLRQTETLLQHAKASVEASQEQQTMLYSAFSDMEKLIVDLKAKASKAESRAETAEVNCIHLTESNLELNKALGHLRGRIKQLKESLHQANDAKLITAKNIGIRAKVIIDLVMQLTMERERLQKQVDRNEKDAYETESKLTIPDCTISIEPNIETVPII